MEDDQGMSLEFSKHALSRLEEEDISAPSIEEAVRDPNRVETWDSRTANMIVLGKTAKDEILTVVLRSESAPAQEGRRFHVLTARRTSPNEQRIYYDKNE